ncbi:MAG: hypothetical protein ACKOZM_07510 [Flavobacteriales bacterium]
MRSLKNGLFGIVCLISVASIGQSEATLQPGATVCWFEATTLPPGSYLVSGMSGTAFFSKGVVVSH